MNTYNLPKKPKVLIFDIDSTLYTCPEYAHEQIDCQIRHFAELNGMTHDEARKLVADFRRNWAREHGGKKISLGNLLAALGISIETSIEWRKTLFNPYDYMKRDERLIGVLSQLGSSLTLVCATNNPVEPARKTLDALGVSPLIEHIVGLDTCLASKPSEKILAAATALASQERGEKVGYGECISIGDRFDIDLDLPIRLGMGGILVSGVEEVYQIPAVLGF